MQTHGGALGSGSLICALHCMLPPTVSMHACTIPSLVAWHAMHENVTRLFQALHGQRCRSMHRHLPLLRVMDVCV